MASNAFEGFLSTPAMLATFGEPAIVQAMLDFEAALAQAEADEGVIPAAAAAAIAAACRAECIDIPALVQHLEAEFERLALEQRRLPTRN